jgi:probable rRNA maturation factor
MPVLIDVEDNGWRRVPDLDDLAKRSVAAALAYGRRSPDLLEVSVLFIGDEEAARINSEWRGKSYPPNVLSFPAAPAMEVPEGEAEPLGDIVLAAGVIAREAKEQSKSFEAHTSHLIVHGTLHLLGYDHMEPSDALKMEAAEAAILRGLGYPDPYDP